MDATTHRRNSRRTPIVLLTLIAASGLFAGRSADASAMNKTLHARSQRGQALAMTRYTRAEQRLSNYYAQALVSHKLNVFVPQVLRNIQSDQGLLHESSFVAYLEWRRSLAPARFDFYHPGIARSIITDQQIRHSVVDSPPSVVPDPTLNPAPGGLSPPTPPGIPPVTTPEPSSWVIACVLIGAGAWARRSGGRAIRG